MYSYSYIALLQKIDAQQTTIFIIYNFTNASFIYPPRIRVINLFNLAVMYLDLRSITFLSWHAFSPNNFHTPLPYYEYMMKLSHLEGRSCNNDNNHLLLQLGGLIMRYVLFSVKKNGFCWRTFFSFCDKPVLAATHQFENSQQARQWDCLTTYFCLDFVTKCTFLVVAKHTDTQSHHNVQKYQGLGRRWPTWVKGWGCLIKIKYTFSRPSYRITPWSQPATKLKIFTPFFPNPIISLVKMSAL